MSLQHELARAKPEHIICAAIWFDDGEKHEYQPDGILTGLVYCGHRHHCIFQQVTKSSFKNYRQGFLTSKNRFVERIEAAKIAHAVGQIQEPKYRLFSEDIY